jgi:hypothetical protein
MTVPHMGTIACSRRASTNPRATLKARS